jgi:hypothetical protein
MARISLQEADSRNFQNSLASERMARLVCPSRSQDVSSMHFGSSLLCRQAGDSILGCGVEEAVEEAMLQGDTGLAARLPTMADMQRARCASSAPDNALRLETASRSSTPSSQKHPHDPQW